MNLLRYIVLITRDPVCIYNNKVMQSWQSIPLLIHSVSLHGEITPAVCPFYVLFWTPQTIVELPDLIQSNNMNLCPYFMTNRKLVRLKSEMHPWPRQLKSYLQKHWTIYWRWLSAKLSIRNLTIRFLFFIIKTCRKFEHMYRNWTKKLRAWL